MHGLLPRLALFGPVALVTGLAMIGALRALPLVGHWRWLFAVCVAADVALVAASAWGGLLGAVRSGARRT